LRASCTAQPKGPPQDGIRLFQSAFQLFVPFAQARQDRLRFGVLLEDEFHRFLNVHWNLPFIMA
jgi:hypothetical protein